MTSVSPDPSQTLLAKLSDQLPRLEAVYKDIHAHPELSMQETRTADLAAKHLRDGGYEVTTAIGKTGVVGLLRNGEGPAVMLRADMDALPVREASGVDYASTTAGTVAGSAGPITSAADSLQIRLFGRGAHGSMPQASIDPVVMAAAIVLRLQTIVSREIAATDAAVVTVGVLQAGTKENVIPDEAIIKLNVRTFDEGVRKHVLAAIERIVPSVYGFVGGTDPDIYAKAKAAGRINDLPVNHSPLFAPVIHPTLLTGIEAMVAGALAWLSK